MAKLPRFGTSGITEGPLYDLDVPQEYNGSHGFSGFMEIIA